MMKKDNRGITLIELMIGVTVLAVVAAMVMQLLTSATRMYRSSITYADIQTESQNVSRRLTNALMEADVIGMGVVEAKAAGAAKVAGVAEAAGVENSSETAAERRQTPGGTYLFAGKLEGTKYDGTAFWFNAETGCLYQNSNFSVDVSGAQEPVNGSVKAPDGEKNGADAEKNGADAASVDKTGGTASLSASIISGALDGKKEYLISDKIKSLIFSVPEEDGKRIRTIHFDIVFQYLDSKVYSIHSSATPRRQDCRILAWENE